MIFMRGNISFFVGSLAVFIVTTNDRVASRVEVEWVASINATAKQNRIAKIIIIIKSK